MWVGTLDNLLVYRLANTDNHPRLHSRLWQFLVASQTNVHVLRMCEDAGVSGDKPQWQQWEHATPNREHVTFPAERRWCESLRRVTREKHVSEAPQVQTRKWGLFRKCQMLNFVKMETIFRYCERTTTKNYPFESELHHWGYLCLVLEEPLLITWSVMRKMRVNQAWRV